MDDAAAPIVAEHFDVQQLADLVVAVQRAASARVLHAQPAERVALHVQGDGIGFAGRVDHLDGQVACVVLDAFDCPIQPDFLTQVVVAVVAELVGFAVFVDQLYQPLCAVVHEFHATAHRIDAPGRQAARVAFVARAVLGGIDDGGQAAQFVIMELLYAALGVDDGRHPAGRVVAVDGRVAHRVGNAGEQAVFVVGVVRRFARAVRVFEQLRAQVPAHVLVAAARVADRVWQAARVVSVFGRAAFRIGDDDQVAALVVIVLPAVACGVDFRAGQVEAVVPLGYITDH